MKCHHVRVVLGPANTGHVWIDGQEVPNVSRVRIKGGVNESSVVELDLFAVDIEAEIAPEEDVDAG